MRPGPPTAATGATPPMDPGPGEPAAGPWREVPFDELVRLLVPGPPLAAPRVVAVDGRSGGGKSTLADRLHRAVPDSAVVHTDDVAWHHARFDWADLLVDGVLTPARTGAGVRFRPPAWDARGRPGAIEVPAGTRLVIVEGVGAGRRELTSYLDAVAWVQSDRPEAERLGIDRDVASGVNGDRAAATAFWRDWEAEEAPFVARDRPWERATVVVAGTSALPVRASLVWVAPPPRDT